METAQLNAYDYSAIDSAVRYAVFESCCEQGLQMEELRAEYHHQLRLLAPRPLAVAAISNTVSTVMSTSEIVSDQKDTDRPSRTIISIKDKS